MTRLIFRETLPPPASISPGCLLIYDRTLDRRCPGFKPWRQAFPAAYPVIGGERLKDVASFPGHARRIVDLSRRRGPIRAVLAAGGGSVGDFAGFLASVLRRGIPLLSLPTTWLAALDSCHGGKTALNVAGAKNQLGTFHPADRAYLVRRVLFAQPAARAAEAAGELAKIALIDGGPWVRGLAASRLRGGPLLWRFLRPAIAGKLRVVRRDPREASGQRRVLNLGHTLGHALEALLRLPHGAAVGQGLLFALRWSTRRHDVSEPEVRSWRRVLEAAGVAALPLRPGWRPVPLARLRAALAFDKKRVSADAIEFVFLRAAGRPVRENVSLQAVLEEAASQGFAR